MKSIAPPILAVGSLAFDTIETPSGKREKTLGGSVNYFSIAASFFAPVKIIGIVGEDFPKAHLNWLSSRCIDVSGVKTVPGKTFHWVGSYNHNLNEATTLSTFLNVFEHFDPTLNELQCDAQYVFLGNIDPALQLKVLNQVHSPQWVACDSMNFWITGKPDVLRETLKKVDILSINEGESFLLTGEKGLLKAAKKIQAMGPAVVIIKRGEYGAILVSPMSVFLAPAFPIPNVVDPTGAGDSFAGAFMGYLAEAKASRTLLQEDPKHLDSLLRRAVLSGCVMASFTVEDFSVSRLMTLENSEREERQNLLMQMITV